MIYILMYLPVLVLSIFLIGLLIIFVLPYIVQILFGACLFGKVAKDSFMDSVGFEKTEFKSLHESLIVCPNCRSINKIDTVCYNCGLNLKYIKGGV